MNNPVEEHLLNISRRQFFGKMVQGIGAMGAWPRLPAHRCPRTYREGHPCVTSEEFLARPAKNREGAKPTTAL